jgi:hypothetical protein
MMISVSSPFVHRAIVLSLWRSAFAIKQSQEAKWMLLPKTTGIVSDDVGPEMGPDDGPDVVSSDPLHGFLEYTGNLCSLKMQRNDSRRGTDWRWLSHSGGWIGPGTGAGAFRRCKWRRARLSCCGGPARVYLLQGMISSIVIAA